MPWDQLAYFAMMFMVALSILTISVGVTVRLFLGPVIKEVADRFASRPAADESRLLARIDLLDERLTAIEGGLERIEAAQDFDRRLGRPETHRSESA